MTRDEEALAVAQGGPAATRASARLMANRARGILLDVNKLLAAIGDREGAEKAALAITAVTDVMASTFDAPTSMAFRLPEEVDTSHLSPQARMVAEALKRDGMVLKDPGVQP